MGIIIQDRHKYPIDNTMDFEYYVLQNIRTTERKPIPVTWTAYYKLAKYGKDKRKIEELQDYINTLYGKWFTVCQWDDGILNDLSHLDCKVLNMGHKSGYPLPLICKPHLNIINQKKDIFCSFIGKNTHPIREEVLSINHPNWFITSVPHRLETYCNILSRSIFSLCPRGYGVSSFRIMESMQYGAIPVYISDEFIEPHYINFNTYGIKIEEKDIKNLKKILNSFSEEEIKQKQKAVKYAYENYYTYKANLKIIQNLIENGEA